jgi:subtilisin family serine protease/subtilisin-like proprotein convertase family protein
MSKSLNKWVVVALLCLAGALWLWRKPAREASHPAATPQMLSSVPQPQVPKVTPPHPVATNGAVAKALEIESYRLSNTTTPLNQLLRRDTAILLEGARIDTAQPLNLNIPPHLRAAGDPGSYIVQSRGPIDDAFRARLNSAGVTLVSYIPNNAWLVRASQAQAQALAAQPEIAAAIPFEPFYKVKSSLLPFAVDQTPLPAGQRLNLVLFADAVPDTLNSLSAMGVNIGAQGPSPFGPVVTVEPPANSLSAIAALPGVQLIERAARRVYANDLARVKMGVSTDTVTNANYFGLSGTNIIVAQVDSGVDMTQPDLVGRVLVNSPNAGQDTDGHGTHVAGIIAGSGVSSSTLTNPPSGSVTNANFRGKAPASKIYIIATSDAVTGGLDHDSYLQQQAALTNAFISNNSWGFQGDTEYDIAAASYDAAVRDALPQQPGSHPVVFVFAAGNSGAGDDDGKSGVADSISSPATAKNVITVGALEQLRNITNQVVLDGVTNQVFAGRTDSDNQVASYSSRGNVGIGVEGVFGRFKPDVVAPGTFVVSTRSAQWDQGTYFSITNRQTNAFPNQVVAPKALNQYSIFVPADAVGLVISVTAVISPTNSITNLPVYISTLGSPTTADPFRTNTLSVPPDFPFTAGINYFYAVGNPSAVSNAYFTVSTSIISTNNLVDLNRVLKMLDDALAPDYRYESGTSMAAPAVSGMLALMQEYYEQRLKRTNSPAMMKALLINGARSASSIYNFQTQPAVNFQGWGLASLPTSLPQSTNGPIATNNTPFIFIDQEATNGLATGQSHTRLLTVAATAQQQPLRFTLVWTDPPGNPAAGVKLVNDLDLIVTNLDTHDVYYGNDIRSGSDFTSPTDTNGPPNIDSINNVENVYLSGASGTNFSVTVVGHRVNVNAVTANQSGTVQDYALVITCGDGQVTNAFTLTDQPTISTLVPDVTTMTNSTNGLPLLNQTVGANAPFFVGPNGDTNQWHFYTLTNNTIFTNAAFLTFLPPTLSVPRLGVRAGDSNQISRPEADIDLYVTTDPTITNLNPAAINASLKSRGRGGTESVVISNAQPNTTYYVGVKSEDAIAGQYGFLGVFSENPFTQNGPNGEVTVRCVPVPLAIPDGSPAHPGAALIFGIVGQPIQARRVVVTNTITHQNFGDLLVNLSHNSAFAVLRNHTFGNGALTQTTVYDDSGQGDIVGAQHSDGPGSLRNFVGQDGSGSWLLTVVDDAQTATGRVDNVQLFIEPQQVNSGNAFAVPPQGWFYDFFDVPVGATNLTVTLDNGSATPLPLDLYIKRGDFPTQSSFDKFKTIFPPVGSLSVNTHDLPPLQPGRYFFGVFNANPTPQNHVVLSAHVDLDLNGVAPIVLAATNPVPLLDDAVTFSDPITVTNQEPLVSAEVSLRLSHPRVSDLAITLISPDGARILLFENRGGLDPNGLGGSLVATNPFTPLTGNFLGVTNIVGPLGSVGTLTIDYAISGTNSVAVFDGTNQLQLETNVTTIPSLSVPLGSLSTNFVQIVMNPGNSPDTNALWTNVVSTVNPTTALFATFTEDTNKQPALLKFAPPPFNVPNYTGTNPAFLNGLFFLPEDPLSALKGANAKGDWKLEVWDSRVGATNPQPVLLEWNLSLVFEQPTVPFTRIEPFVTITNTAPPGGFSYLIVDVPSWAQAATNYLLSADLPVNVWYNTNGAPVGTNPPDVLLIGPATNGVSTLTVGGNPSLIPGQSYYIGVQNTNSVAVNYSFRVDFNIVALTNGVPFTSATTSNAIPRYFSYLVSSNASAVNFTLTGLSGDVNLVARQGPPLPTASSFDYGSFNTGTNDESILVFTNGTPVPLRPGTWYLGVLNASGTIVNYTLEAQEFTNAFPTIITLTNGVPFGATNNGAPGSAQYYRYTVTPAAARVQFETFGATGDFTLVARKGLPLPSLSSFDYRSANPGLSDENIVILTNSLPVNLTSGDWFLAVVKISTPPASYFVMATESATTGQPIRLSDFGFNLGDFCVTWNSLPGAHYVVQTNGNLGLQLWADASPTITALDVATTYCIPATSPVNSVRVIEGVAISTNIPPVQLASIQVARGGPVTLTWFGPVQNSFQVQWTASLSPPPVSWTSFTNIVTSTTGIFTFTDDGTQTGGFSTNRFYRLLMLP